MSTRPSPLMSASAQVSFAPRSSMCFANGISSGRLTVHARQAVRTNTAAIQQNLIGRLYQQSTPRGMRSRMDENGRGPLRCARVTEERTGCGGILIRNEKHATAGFRYARVTEERTGCGGILIRNEKHATAGFRYARVTEERTRCGGILTRDEKYAAAAFRCARVTGEPSTL